MSLEREGGMSTRMPTKALPKIHAAVPKHRSPVPNLNSLAVMFGGKTTQREIHADADIDLMDKHGQSNLDYALKAGVGRGRVKTRKHLI